MKYTKNILLSLSVFASIPFVCHKPVALKVEANSLTSIEVIETGLKTEYQVGEVFTVDGGSLKLNYDNGETSTIPLTLDMVENRPTTSQGKENYPVYISYQGLSTSYEIDVIDSYKPVPVVTVFVTTNTCVDSNEDNKNKRIELGNKANIEFSNTLNYSFDVSINPSNINYTTYFTFGPDGTNMGNEKPTERGICTFNVVTEETDVFAGFTKTLTYYLSVTPHFSFSYEDYDNGRNELESGATFTTGTFPKIRVSCLEQDCSFDWYYTKKDGAIKLGKEKLNEPGIYAINAVSTTANHVYSSMSQFRWFNLVNGKSSPNVTVTYGENEELADGAVFYNLLVPDFTVNISSSVNYTTYYRDSNNQKLEQKPTKKGSYEFVVKTEETSVYSRNIYSYQFFLEEDAANSYSTFFSGEGTPTNSTANFTFSNDVSNRLSWKVSYGKFSSSKAYLQLGKYDEDKDNNYPEAVESSIVNSNDDDFSALYNDIKSTITYPLVNAMITTEYIKNISDISLTWKSAEGGYVYIVYKLEGESNWKILKKDNGDASYSAVNEDGSGKKDSWDRYYLAAGSSTSEPSSTGDFVTNLKGKKAKIGFVFACSLKGTINYLNLSSVVINRSNSIMNTLDYLTTYRGDIAKFNSLIIALGYKLTKAQEDYLRRKEYDDDSSYYGKFNKLYQSALAA